MNIPKGLETPSGRGDPLILRDNKGRFLYKNTISGEYFWSNPNDPQDIVVADAASMAAGLAVSGGLVSPKPRGTVLGSGGGSRPHGGGGGRSTNLTNSQVGDIVGWGKGRNAVRETLDRVRNINTAEINKMIREGLTKNDVNRLLNVYNSALRNPTKNFNTQLRPRRLLMRRIIRLWPQ